MPYASSAGLRLDAADRADDSRALKPPETSDHNERCAVNRGAARYELIFPAHINASPAPGSPDNDGIDVVIPVYNGASYILDCVSSVLSQTLKPRSVIIIDDGSTDETVELVNSLLKSHPIVMLHRVGRNIGVSAARNAGIRLSKAPFVAFIDADDIWAPNKLALQLQVFKSASRPVGFVHSSYFFIGEAGDRLSDQNDMIPDLLRGDVFSRLLREGNILSGSASSILIKRDVLDRAGFFAEDLHFGEDWDLWLRLAAISEADHTSEAVVGIRIHPRSATQKVNSSIDRFFQCMTVYSRWSEIIKGDEEFVQRLRKEGFRAMLSGARSYSELDAFYRQLKTSKQELAHNLFQDRRDFFSGLLMAAAATVFTESRNLVLGNIRRPLRDFGWIR